MGFKNVVLSIMGWAIITTPGPMPCIDRPDLAFTQHVSGPYPVSRLPPSQRARRTSSTCSPGSFDPPLDVENELLWCVTLPLAGRRADDPSEEEAARFRARVVGERPPARQWRRGCQSLERERRRRFKTARVLLWP